MNEHFSKKDDRSVVALENDSKNLAKLPQVEIVKFTGEPIVCSRIRLFKAIVDLRV